MQSNIPRAAIHVGKDKKSFSAQVGNEAERRGWDENVYRLKNADKEKNNHYNFSRKNLNFEIVKDGKIVPLGSNPIPLHERIQMRLDELGFKPYMDARHPDQVSKNSPNCTVGMIFSGDHDVLYNFAFGNQRIDTANPDADHSHIVLQQGIYKWAKDTYDFACRKWGEENIISFAVHCDETSIHVHVQTIPVEKVKKRGRIGSKYVNKNNPDIVLSTKEWRALPKEERDNYTKQTASKDYVECVSYAKVWGETRKAKSEYLSQLHTDYHNEVGRKYGLAHGIPYNELSEEEKRGRRHKNKVVLEAERQAKAALDKVEKYAVLATIDKQELTFPLLNMYYSNAGTFIPGTLENALRNEEPQTHFRNECLCRAMVDFNMIDTVSRGIKKMFNEQWRRHFPMPDYEIDQIKKKVIVRIYGNEINKRYTDLLKTNDTLSLWDCISLDAVQKGRTIHEDIAQNLLKRGLIEGEAPHYNISLSIAKDTHQLPSYTKTKGLDKERLRQMVLQYLSNAGEEGAKRDSIYEYLKDVLPANKTEEQQLRYVGRLLVEMNEENSIDRIGLRWILK